DDLVGDGEQPRREGQAKRFRGLQIDDELEFGGPQYWQVRKLLAFENASYVDTGLTIRVFEVGAVGHQSARVGELAQIIDHRDGMACCQCNQLFAPTEKKWIVADDEGTEPFLGGVSGLSSALKFGGFLTNPDARGMRGLRPVNAMLRFPSAPWLRPLLPPRGSWRRQAENRPRHAGRKLGVPVGALALPRKGTLRTLTGFPSHSRVAYWGPQQPFACRGKIERTRHSSSFNYTSEQYRGPNDPAVMPVTILTID